MAHVSVEVVHSPISSSNGVGETTIPQGWLPQEIIVPLTMSTYLNNSGYRPLVSAYFSSLSTVSHISPTSSSGIFNARPTSRIAPLSAMVLNVIISLQYKPG